MVTGLEMSLIKVSKVGRFDSCCVTLLDIFESGVGAPRGMGNELINKTIGFALHQPAI